MGKATIEGLDKDSYKLKEKLEMVVMVQQVLEGKNILLLVDQMAVMVEKVEIYI